MKLIFSLSTFLVTTMHTMLVTSQTVDPGEISIDGSSEACGSSETTNVCITLPPSSTIDKVDIFLLFDDTGSFEAIVPTLSDLFSSLVTDLEDAVPFVDFGFGVGRFEDYGGPGRDYGGSVAAGRPFILNQPIITAADAGSSDVRNSLITSALRRRAPANGGDNPESAIAEGLFQVATGVGFDGDGDGSTQGIDNSQPAGSVAAQVTPDSSGDVPAFSTLTVNSSGNVGGAGFRDDALKLVILATDVCSIAAFDSTLGLPPLSITGSFSTEPTTGLICINFLGSFSRYGYVGNAKSSSSNNITNAVVPAGAATVPRTIAALNAAGIRVIGLGPSAVPVPIGSGSSFFDPSYFLSAIARLTGAVDETGKALVFSIGAGGEPLKRAILNAIEATVTSPIDVTLETTTGSLPDGFLSVVDSPDVVEDVLPNGQACFNVTFEGENEGFNGTFDLVFKDAISNLVLGSIPVTVDCSQPTLPPTPSPTREPTPRPSTKNPTSKPTRKPTPEPTRKPTRKPTHPPAFSRKANGNHVRRRLMLDARSALIQEE